MSWRNAAQVDVHAVISMQLVRGLPSAKERQARAEKGSKARTHRHSPCVWSDELIAQPAWYWVTESHQVAPLVSKDPNCFQAAPERERETDQQTTEQNRTDHWMFKPIACLILLLILLIDWHPSTYTCVRLCAARCDWHRMQRLPFA
jgi:hypothetical protein